MPYLFDFDCIERKKYENLYVSGDCWSSWRSAVDVYDWISSAMVCLLYEHISAPEAKLYLIFRWKCVLEVLDHNLCCGGKCQNRSVWCNVERCFLLNLSSLSIYLSIYLSVYLPIYLSSSIYSTACRQNFLFFLLQGIPARDWLKTGRPRRAQDHWAEGRVWGKNGIMIGKNRHKATIIR